MNSTTRFSLSLFLVISAFVIGFIYAGVTGMIFFGLLFTLSIFLLKKEYLRITSFIICFIVFSGIGYSLMIFFGLIGANKEIHSHLDQVKCKLVSEGYHPRWIIISQKRNNFYNELLPNSAKNGKSAHLKGNAIDIFVIDVDGDFDYDRHDFELIKNASVKLYDKHQLKKLRIKSYLDKGVLTKHMVHLQNIN